MPSLVFIEGNIGSGKTTLVRMLADRYRDDPRVSVAEEPVGKWVSSNGVNLLSWFYANLESVAMEFEMFIGASKVSQLTSILSTAMEDVVIIERSLWSQLHCFLPMHRAYVEPRVMSLLERVVGDLAEFFEEMPRRFVYIRCDAETCVSRIRGRDRPGEDGITLDYVSALGETHEAYFRDLPGCVVVDNDRALSAVTAMVDSLL